MARKQYRGSIHETPVVPGAVFGRLTVLRFSHTTRRDTGRRNGWKSSVVTHYWECHCVCGTMRVVNQRSLVSGNTQSCGCLQRDTPRANRTHGHSETSMYYRWHSIRKRCYDPNDKQYKHYGGRGIAMAPEWYDSLERFIEDVGQPPFPGATLDREDNEKGYEPGNVRWVTNIEQQSNKRSNRLLTFEGKTATLAQWERDYGFRPGTLDSRLELGWSVADALTTPLNTRGRRPYTYQGKTQSQSQWERDLGLAKGQVGARLKNGWSLERALTTPGRRKQCAVCSQSLPCSCTP